MPRSVILFLAANPAGTSELALGQECAAIESELERTPGRDDLELRSKWAVTVDELMRHLTALKPAILHFSGHGGQHRATAENGPSRPARRDIEAGDGGGIYLQDEHGRPQHVSQRALRQIIESAGPSTRVVVLNACFSDAVAEELRGVVDCVIGMRGAVVDDAARAFAVGFYRALGHGQSIGNAYAQAKATLAGKGLTVQAEPRCLVRPGLDVDTLVIGGGAPRRTMATAQLAAAATGAATAPGDPIAAWLQFGLKRHGRVMVVGFRDAAIPIELDRVFVPLHVYADRARKGSGPDARGGEERLGHGGAEVSLDEALADRSDGRTCLALIGDPGAGKTTLLRHLFRRAAAGEMTGSVAHLRGLHPVLVRLATVTEGEQVARGLERIVARTAAEDGYPGAGPALLAQPGQGFLFLLDGLDEVRDEPTRKRICAWLTDEIDHWPACAFVVTSRRAAWARTPALGARFLPVSVQSLHGDAIAEYVRRWFRAVVQHFSTPVDSPADVEALASAKATALLEVLATPTWRSNPRLLEMTANPLMLSTLCLAYYSDTRLPDRRGELYERTLGLLIETWTRERPGAPALPLQAARLVLQPLAYAMQEQDRPELLIDEAAALVKKPLSRVPALRTVAPTPERFLDLVRDECGVLKSRDLGRIEFVHLCFQEYLAACHASSCSLGRELADRAGDPRWEEVILLAMSRPGVFEPFMARARERGDVDAALLRQCLRERDEVRPGSSAAKPVDSRLLKPLSRSRSGWGLGTTAAIATAAATVVLTTQLWEDRTKSAVAVADPAGDKATPSAALEEQGPPWLAWIGIVAAIAFLWLWLARRWLTLRPVLPSRVGTGGPREGQPFVEPVTGIELVWIPGGSFLMGSSKERDRPNYDPEANHDELPAHHVQLTGFWMSVYPITNEQYTRFVTETGHAAPASFTDRRFNDPAQPVVTVSWEDARAFTAWLSSKLTGTEARLPTEAEWEYAARGTDGRRYPWGDTPPDALWATFGQSWDAGRPAPVGHTPGGKSPFEVHDLAGNVLEWCLDDKAESYTELQPGLVDPCHRGDARSGLRVVRGGSYLLGPPLLRSACRGGFPFGDRTSDLGFRVVCGGARHS